MFHFFRSCKKIRRRTCRSRNYGNKLSLLLSVFYHYYLKKIPSSSSIFQEKKSEHLLRHHKTFETFFFMYTELLVVLNLNDCYFLFRIPHRLLSSDQTHTPTHKLGTVIFCQNTSEMVRRRRLTAFDGMTSSKPFATIASNSLGLSNGVGMGML